MKVKRTRAEAHHLGDVSFRKAFAFVLKTHDEGFAKLAGYDRRADEPKSASIDQGLERNLKKLRTAWLKKHRGSWELRARRMLRRRFPFLLARMTEVPTFRGMDHSITRDGLLVERGWLSLVTEVCERLATLTPPSKRDAYQIVQIKEKWGELRIYLTNCNAKMYRVLMSARKRSVLICEMCGRPGKLMTGLGHYGSTVQTVCTKHAIVRRRVEEAS